MAEIIETLAESSAGTIYLLDDGTCIFIGRKANQVEGLKEVIRNKVGSDEHAIVVTPAYIELIREAQDKLAKRRGTT